MRDLNIERTKYIRYEPKFSKELCLEILEMRRNGHTFSNIYYKLNLEKYYKNRVKSVNQRFYRDCETYGIDVSSVHGKRNVCVTSDKYNEMCEDLKNNPKVYTMKEFLKKHNLSSKQIAIFYDKRYIYGLIRLCDLADNFIYSRPRNCDNVRICHKQRHEQCIAKFKKMQSRIECGDSFSDFYKEFGYKTPDSCKFMYEKFLKNYL